MQPLSLLLLATGAIIISTGGYAQTFATLHSFSGGSDGGVPFGGVVQDAAGTIYGTTSSGGDATCNCGTLYSFSASAGFKVLVTFLGPNGASGQSTLTLSGSTLYGDTVGGGVNNDGTVFSVQTDGSNFTLLHQFDGTSGRNPSTPLSIDANGALYGATLSGGLSDAGVLFSLAPSGTYTNLHDFSQSERNPGSLLLTGYGVLVGTTELHGGALFTYNTSSGNYTVQHFFRETHGSQPFVGSVGENATVYGADGDVFSLSPLQGFSVLAESGSHPPSGPSLAPDGSLIGVTVARGYSGVLGKGALYRLAGGSVAVLHQFDGGAKGGFPRAQPLVSSDGSIIGTAASGGLQGKGFIYRYKS